MIWLFSLQFGEGSRISQCLIVVKVYLYTHST